MDRLKLQLQIQQYKAYDQNETAMQARFIELLQDPNCFLRSRLDGHITASAWVLDYNQEKVLLMHHKKLDKWLQPGGHCDGDENTLRVALKEIEEETGLSIKGSNQPIFDLDIHIIPQKKEIPQHEHFDVRYKFVASKGAIIVKNDESNALEWVNLDNLESFTKEESILRMLRKCKPTVH